MIRRPQPPAPPPLPPTLYARIDNHPSWPVVCRLLQFRSLAFGLLFLLYLRYLQPVFLERMVRIYHTQQGDWLIGALLVLIHPLELMGFAYKFPALRERIRRQAEPWPGSFALIGLGTMLRIGMSMFVVFYSLPALGLDPHGSGLCNGLLVFGLGFLLLVKEAIIITPFYEKEKTLAMPSVELFSARVQIEETLGELLLSVCSMTLFTLTWDLLVLTIPAIEAEHYATGLLGAIMVYSAAYLYSRLVFAAEEWLTRQKVLNRILSLLIYLGVMYLVISRMPVQ